MSKLGDEHAFPVAWPDAAPSLGLTKREHYAGLAMQALICRPCDNARIPPEAEVAVDAVDYADALIKELEIEKEVP